MRDFLKTGPLGFPVVDLAVNLVEGSYHSVNSSDMAFQMAAKIAMKEGMAACSPVLLEPIMKVEVYTPSDATAKATAIVSQRRGHILGFDARPGWPGWDILEATMPLSEISDLIIELQVGDGGRGELQGALRSHGRTDRAAGRRCDERKGEGGLSTSQKRRPARGWAGRRFLRDPCPREAADDQVRRKSTVVLAEPGVTRRTRLFAADSGRCPHPPAPAAPPRPDIRLDNRSASASYRTLHATVTRLERQEFRGLCATARQQKSRITKTRLSLIGSAD